MFLFFGENSTIRVTTELYSKGTIIFVNVQSIGAPDSLHSVSSLDFKCLCAVVSHCCFIQLSPDGMGWDHLVTGLSISSFLWSDVHIEVLGCSLAAFWGHAACFREQSFSIGILCKYFLLSLIRLYISWQCLSWRRN